MNIEIKDTFFYSKKTLNLRGNLFDLSYPAVMGILNVTPDSFYDGARHTDEKKMIEKVSKMLLEGASFIDIGGYSSRPGATEVSEEEELKRVLNALQLILREFPKTNISIDTFRASIAKAAVEHGACMINDISGGDLDKNMLSTVGQLKVPYVMMHMRGKPATMQKHTQYNNVVADLLDYFHPRLAKARENNIRDIIIDPGFGFAKTTEQNYDLLKNLSIFKILNLPLLAGISRKSMIYKTLNTDPESALNGTTTLHAIALMNKVSILRVHDVKEAVEAITLYKTTYN